MKKNVTFNCGGRLVPAQLEETDNLIAIHFGFNAALKDHVKSMDGSKWVPEGKYWTVKNTERNRFQLKFITCRDFNDPDQNPYYKYDLPLVDYKPTRSLMAHQIVQVQHGITRRGCIFACEMGTGKTLSAIEIMEYFLKQDNIQNWWWVSVNSALAAVELEFIKWKSLVRPRMITYGSLHKAVQEMGRVPQGVIFDESSKLKTPETRTSNAAVELIEYMHKKHDQPIIIEMSGTPAPKSPADWWNPCEIACPGFLKEGNINKFKNSLSLMKMMESLGGTCYPKLITWFDDEKKCKVCGEYAEHDLHIKKTLTEFHNFVPSVNEVERLGRRMKGLVLVQYKRDCIKDLPEKQYRIVNCTPKPETLRAAKMLKNILGNGVRLMEAMRQISDGFRYEDLRMDGVKIMCPCCNGAGEKLLPIESDDIENEEEGAGVDFDEDIPMALQKCLECSGTGKVDKFERVATYVGSPKEQALLDLLEEVEDVGRIVIFAGFTGSVDICYNLCKRAGWDVFKFDGHGTASTTGVKDLREMLGQFQDPKKYPNKTAFVLQADSGGMGITLTASPMTVYYSNTFKAESRQQSEDRIHRPGMDVNRGATIVDLIHLPFDQYVLENLKKKKDLQILSMKFIHELMSAGQGER